jgi:DNA-nicking Smr family endonuclease
MADDDQQLDDDFALFRVEMADTSPLRQDSFVSTFKKPEITVKVKARQPLNENNRLDAFSDMTAPENIGNEDYLAFQGDGVQNKLFSKMRQGKIHIGAALDLHGMTVEKAEPELIDFLIACQQQQIRFARIIHGKGWGSQDNKPVLKGKVNHWLRQSGLVLAFCSAIIKDGGTGAVYVLIRK